ncbi:restriction endonuclease [Frankia sp. CNm7]|uniref:Restriction endonuclease n=1 Tax=Frankia nepalensis TaxID=1836974 RepID=A0A937RL26_9ACTN|nr:restriction endonuclease [Frankia nepalensis]MBL7498456.1 restriction endonuclease [Frankia nepalensis]MBL7509479.1 restriction endonuclease [Frankia nepalensis]MBL7520738.1 restriction endonuclease [Frankia nepalensis]MBL7629289.1 restriction endonuclease [Frankia nepalensis]
MTDGEQAGWSDPATRQRLSARYEQLDQLASDLTAQRRGVLFNGFLADMLTVYGVDALANQETELGELDVVFRLHGTRYVLEAKWYSSKIDYGPLSVLASRVRQRAEGTFGIFVSMSGYTEPALDSLRRDGQRPRVLLFEREHVEAMVYGKISPQRLIEAARDVASFRGSLLVGVDDLVSAAAAPADHAAQVVETGHDSARVAPGQPPSDGSPPSSSIPAASIPAARSGGGVETPPADVDGAARSTIGRRSLLLAGLVGATAAVAVPVGHAVNGRGPGGAAEGSPGPTGSASPAPVATATADGSAPTDSDQPFRLSVLGPMPGSICAVAFSPTDDLLATGGWEWHNNAMLWTVGDVASPRRVWSNDGQTLAVFALAFSPDGKLLAAGNSPKDRASTLDLWTIGNPRRPQGGELSGHAAEVHAVAFSSDGATLVSADDSGLVLIWELPARQAGRLPGSGVSTRALAFHPKGPLLAVGADDGTVTMWDVTDRARPVARSTRDAHFGKVEAIAFSARGHRMATTGTDGSAALWDTSDPEEPKKIVGLRHDGAEVHTAAFTNDDRRLVTGDGRGIVRVWDLESASPGTVADWTAHTGAVRSVHVGRAGVLATGGEDDTAILWRLP